jgi:hypothetical protein
VFTDLYMWQQFLAQPGLRVASSSRPTLVHFATPLRTDWTLEQRLAELEHWAERLGREDWRRLEPALVAACALGAARLGRWFRLLRPLAALARSRSRAGRRLRGALLLLWRIEIRRVRMQIDTPEG